MLLLLVNSTTPSLCANNAVGLTQETKHTNWTDTEKYRGHGLSVLANESLASFIGFSGSKRRLGYQRGPIEWPRRVRNPTHQQPGTHKFTFLKPARAPFPRAPALRPFRPAPSLSVGQRRHTTSVQSDLAA